VEPSSPAPTSRWRPRIRALLRLAALVLVLASARSTLADHYRVPTGSMQPTIDIDDRIIVNKAAYGLRVPFTHAFVMHFGGPDVGDVVVLDSPDDDMVLVKRVIGVPGSRVEVRGGHVTIDGMHAVVEQRSDGLFEHLAGATHPIDLSHGGGPDFGPLVIPDGYYLVMGDNRGDSRDGRMFGLVERDAILGRAVGVYWRGAPSWNGL
jgi:signal peptidase I